MFTEEDNRRKVLFDQENIRRKVPKFGKVTFNKDQTWDEAMKFYDTHPKDLIDVNTEKMRVYLKSAHLRGSLDVWAKDIIKEMRKVFHRNNITLINFLGFGHDTDSYPWHKDKMDVFLVQVLGNVNLKVEHTFCEETPIIFTPGDCVYIPRGTHHHIMPSQSRVTFSFGVEGDVDPSTYV
jgi:mannose-6-phosphate isomerase-like protein (cupin superfamily)